MEILTASLKERLWHKMREDLAVYAPAETAANRLMCCACGRFLPPEQFSLEHIIPRQALADDPQEVKDQFTANQRSGLMLLCTKPLRIKDRIVYANGCNSWKGKFYDQPLRELMNGRAMAQPQRRLTEQYTVAMSCAAYLAMVHQFGYQVALTPSGLLMRHQFFQPRKFCRDMPLRSQMILTGEAPPYADEHLEFWSQPFRFTIEPGTCYVAIKNSVIILPLSRDPRVPLAKRLLIKPARYTMRPDFSTRFNE